MTNVCMKILHPKRPPDWQCYNQTSVAVHVLMMHRIPTGKNPEK
jgi:hypothetical protein